MASSDDNRAVNMQQQVMRQWTLVNRLAAKRFQQEETAEEAALYVLDKLSEDDWRRLRMFEGKSKFTTFLSSVTYRLLEDYARIRFGRVTPPKWIKELGGIWLTLFRLLCLERFSFHDAILKMQNIRRDVSEKRIEESAEHLLGELPNCGKSVQEQEYNDGVHGVDENSLAAEIKEKDLIVQAITREIFGELQSNREEQLIKKLLDKRLSLKPEEQLLLRLRFREGISVSEIGKMLGLNRFQVNGRIRRTLEKVRAHFKRTGCEEELKQLFS